MAPVVAVPTDDIEQRRHKHRGAQFSEKAGEKAFIVRACSAENTTFQGMDYVYVSKGPITAGSIRGAVQAFRDERQGRTKEERLLIKAIEHACTCAAYHDELQHVLVRQVSAGDVYHAPNTGEFFYDGVPIVGRPAIAVDIEGGTSIVLTKGHELSFTM